MTGDRKPRVWNKRDPNTPKDAVYVGRPSKWGNPYSHLASKQSVVYVPTREEAVEKYKVWVAESCPEYLQELRTKLRGKDLVCRCAPKSCHADVLLEIANEEGGDDERG